MSQIRSLGSTLLFFFSNLKKKKRREKELSKHMIFNFAVWKCFDPIERQLCYRKKGNLNLKQFYSKQGKEYIML